MNNFPGNNFGGMNFGGGMSYPGMSYQSLDFPIFASPTTTDHWDFSAFAPPETYSRRTDRYAHGLAQADRTTMKNFPINANTPPGRLDDFITAARQRIQYWSRRIQKKSNPGFGDHGERDWEPFNARDFLSQLESRLRTAEEERNRRMIILHQQHEEQIRMEMSGMLPRLTPSDWAQFPADMSSLPTMSYHAPPPPPPPPPPPASTERSSRRSSRRTRR